MVAAINLKVSNDLMINTEQFIILRKIRFLAQPTPLALMIALRDD